MEILNKCGKELLEIFPKQEEAIVETPAYIKYYIEDNQVFSKSYYVVYEMLTNIKVKSYDDLLKKINNKLYDYVGIYEIKIYEELNNNYNVVIRGNLDHKGERILARRRKKLEKLIPKTSQF